MLREIHIQNYAVVEDLTIELGPGLNVLSGETGSGKSIVVGALGLALGGRATADAIRTGCNAAAISAVFDLTADENRSWFEDAGLPAAPELILRRIVQSSGRSRLLVNDQPVTLAAANSLAGNLVEIHGQNEQISLFSRQKQLEMLDRFASAEPLLERVGEIHARRRKLEQEIEALSQSEQDRQRTLDLLKFQLGELDSARLEPGEDIRLTEEKQILAHVEKIQSAVASAYGSLYEDDHSACEKLGVADRALGDLVRYDPAFEPYLGSLSEAKAQIEDLAFVLRDYGKNLKSNPRRLEEIENRLALLDSLKRKHGTKLDELIARREEIRARLGDLEHSDERRETAGRELAEVSAEYRKAAEELSAKRRTSAVRLAKFLRLELADLNMAKTRFEIHFEAPPPDAVGSEGGPLGFDQIDFLISPNPGEELRPLGKIASGGELSRVMLALKTVLGAANRRGDVKEDLQHVGGPTFIFDEVDTGIGGRLAESVGLRLKKLAAHAQVICVTHVPQIACFADHHFRVEKFEQKGRTLTRIDLLANEKERVAELARMLSGSKLTDAALEHAATMLKQSRA